MYVCMYERLCLCVCVYMSTVVCSCIYSFTCYVREICGIRLVRIRHPPFLFHSSVAHYP